MKGPGGTGYGKGLWSKIEREYVHGVGGDSVTMPEFPDMEALAAKYGVSIQSIKAHSASKKPTWATRRAIRLAECQARVESNIALRDAREVQKLKTADTSTAE